ncbi:MAG: 8-oxoguanine deaminase [Alphaproteobacteria bacterium]|nr:8-oxoguanine deaminase [Alphaproteobacteria bacterium]
MTTLLLKNADHIATMDAHDRELTNASIFIRDGVIETVGPEAELPADADEVIDLSGHVVTPGMVNTHHHLFQNLTRVVPAAQNETLFGWLKTLYPIWSRINPEQFYAAVALGLAELALSGCTTSSDHQYIFPNGARLDDSIAAARDVGVRFTATRGAMSIGESKGGLPPDFLTEDEDFIRDDSIRLLDAHHDNSRYAMTHVALAPCSPFTVTTELMRDAALLARDKGARLHTHLAENIEDIAYSEANFGKRPGDYAEELGWVGDDVWHAHCVQLNDDEINLFARTGTGVAHCPCSNMRLASGIAPVRKMRDVGVHVGLGVDGSSSNDSAHMLNEARQAMLLQRVGGDPAALTARDALAMATRDGARVLGRDDIGVIAAGYAADIAAYDTHVIDFAGAHSDPIAALIFCGPVKTNHTIINGRVVVRDGVLTTMDLRELMQRHRKHSINLVNNA